MLFVMLSWGFEISKTIAEQNFAIWKAGLKVLKNLPIITLQAKNSSVNYYMKTAGPFAPAVFASRDIPSLLPALYFTYLCHGFQSRYIVV
jgi:hypothetical protein